MGLHPPTDRGRPDGAGVSRSEAGAVHLCFETSEDLADVAARLTSAGFAPEVRTEIFGSVLSVEDGDGQNVEVHRTPDDPE